MANNSGGVINKAVITLNLPEGIAVPGFPAGRNLATESAGDIASGNLVKKTFPSWQQAKTIRSGKYRPRYPTRSGQAPVSKFDRPEK